MTLAVMREHLRQEEEQVARRAWTGGRSMTPDPMDPYDTLTTMANAYRAKFARDVWTWRMDPGRIPAVVAAMRKAMEDGQPLSADEAQAVTGVSPPPMDAVG